MTSAPTTGVTLYSFTRDFHARKTSQWDLIRKAAAHDLGPGLEMVGFQAFRGWPNITDEDVATFKSVIDETGLTPTSMGANADKGLRRDRMLTDDELVEYMTGQIEASSRLGFSVVRVQYSLTPDDLERLVPVAEKAGVAIGLEVHCHHSPNHPYIQAVLDRIQKLDTPHLGFIPDWGTSMTQIPPSLLAKYRAMGVRQDLIDAVVGWWEQAHKRGPVLEDRQAFENIGEIIELAQAHGGGDVAEEFGIRCVGLFGHAPASDWAQLVPYSVHTHGKFYDIDASGDEPSVPIRDILKVYVDGGYSHSISSEWEGFHWNDEDDPFEIVAAEQRLIKKTLAELIPGYTPF